MPLGKYYCDYCDKQFQDTPSARKRHLQGIQHQRARALYYASLNPPASSFHFPSADHRQPTGVCHRFLRTGFCHYGDGCKYLHPKPNATMTLNPNQTVPGCSGPSSAMMVQAPIVLGNQPSSGSLLGSMVRDDAGMPWGTLPPSLRPPAEGGYPTLRFVDWG